MTIEQALVVANVILAAGFGVPLAARLAERRGRRALMKWLAALAGIYVLEGFAFSASMGTNVGSFALAVVWGLVLRRKWREGPRAAVRRRALWVALYTCLPAISFATVLGYHIAAGVPLLSAEAGYEFGIPDFVPWPLCTLAGFFAAVVGSAVVVKLVVTTAIAAGRAPRHGATTDTACRQTPIER